ncbi:MAG: GNAT family N-acetyltransferase [Nocardioides sp.]
MPSDPSADPLPDSLPDSPAASGPETFVVETTTDPHTFLGWAEPYLAREPVLTTVVSTVTHRAVGEAAAGRPAPDHPRWWGVVRDGSGAIAGVAMRTAPFAPYPLFVLPMADGAARALARALHERGEGVGAVNGCLPAARVLAEETARLGGGSARTWEHTRLFELGELVEPRPVPGGLRDAVPADAERCLAWFRAFAADADEQAGRTDGPVALVESFSLEDILERIAGGRIGLWEVDGEVVHLTGFNPPSFGVARVGPVYTPAALRGRGYASAAVAEVSRRLLAQGIRVCLFTDQANPTSNRIYQALGYAPVADMANLVVEQPLPDRWSGLVSGAGPGGP